MTCFEKRRVVWFSEVLIVWKNGLREGAVIKIREEVVCSWFGCKEKKMLFT